MVRAVNVALAHGWRSDGLHAHPEAWTHESVHLLSPDGQVRLDVHRFLPSNWLAGTARSAALSRGLWQRARQVNWQGVPALRLHPLDEVVVAIALGRCWGGDRGGLKGADYLDLELLCRHYGLQAAELAAHAAHLGATQTWKAFWQLCNPLQGQLELRPAVTAPLLQAAAARDGVKRRPQVLGRLRRVLELAPYLFTGLGDMLRAMWAVRRGGDPRTHLQGWTPATAVHIRLSLPQVNRTVSAVRLLTRWLHPRQKREGVCVPRAYATYRALRRLGYPAVFVSGVARSGAGVTGHAWVESDRGPLDAYGEPFNRRQFRVLFQWPPQD
ncbi:lasso peptide biosynthesis B2 protein [Deinococcus multiflagellatus]|uniref:Lasso peptide biosynthesis B2 protein n=1 Tax=Deinococcus multiflagellatus TaxID=1656887 RepID=A0ABW1ZM79_9DEIO